MKKNIFVSISLISALVLALPISAFASSNIGTSVGSSQVCTSNGEGISIGTDTGHSDTQSNSTSIGEGWSKGSGTTSTGTSGDTQSNSTSIGEGWSKGSSTNIGVGTTNAGQSHSTSTSDTQSKGTSTTDATITHGESIGTSNTDATITHGESIGTSNSHSDNCGKTDVNCGWSIGYGVSEGVGKSTSTGYSHNTGYSSNQGKSTSVGDGVSTGTGYSEGTGSSSGTTSGWSSGTSTSDGTSMSRGESSSQGETICGIGHGDSKTISVSVKGCSYSYDSSLLYFGVNKKNTCNVVIMGINKKIVISSDGATELEASPYIKNGSTLVPVRSVSESLKSKVDWDSKTKIVSITNGDTIIKLTVGSLKATVNGKSIILPIEPESKNGRIFVPLRFISENLKANVDWNAQDQLITITK